MDDLKLLIEEVEDEWLGALFDYCKEQFRKVRLSSHNHFHHLRVWLIAKELFQELKKNGVEITRNDLEKTIIAVFFHDIGMIKIKDKTHGKASREICESFFLGKGSKKIDGFDEVLDAIQKHDDKDYRFIVRREKAAGKDVLSVLCASDDLEAFGAIGVFRYAEIYFLRKISIKKLAKKVVPNLDRRYKNFHSLYSNLGIFAKKHKERYKFTRNFYQDLDRELNETEYSKNIFFGAIGVLNILIRDLIEGETSLLDVSGKILKEASDRYVLGFFKRFKKEVECLKFRCALL